MRRCGSLGPALLLLACTERPLGDSATETSDDGSTSPTSSGPGTGVGTTTTTTTTTSTTTAATSAGTTSTSGPGSTVTSTVTGDPSGPDTATTLVPPDLPPVDGQPSGLTGCNLAAPSGTAIKGESSLGVFEGDRAYFGVVWFGSELIEPRLLVLSPQADAAAELMLPAGTTGPILNGEINTEAYTHWPGLWSFPALLVFQGQAASPSVNATIVAFAGNWDAPDPNDPPRLVGSLSGDLAGPFDAVYCNTLDFFFIPE